MKYGASSSSLAQLASVYGYIIGKWLLVVVYTLHAIYKRKRAQRDDATSRVKLGIAVVLKVVKAMVW